MLIQYSNHEAHFPVISHFNIMSNINNNNINDDDDKKSCSVLKKGLVWQHKDKLFSRWKERYFILTKDYLSCFKKATKIAHSDMGGFIFKLNLVDMEGLRWLNSTQNNSKDSDVIVIQLPKKKGPNILLKGEDLMDWFIVLQKTIGFSKERREVLRASTSSLPRGSILSSQLSDGKLVVSPHLYALQHTMSEGRIGLKNGFINSENSKKDQVKLRNVSDHKRTPNLHKRNRLSVFAEFDVDKDTELSSDGDTDHGIGLGTPSPQTTPIQTTQRRQGGGKSQSGRPLVKSYSHITSTNRQDYLCTSSPPMNYNRHSKSEIFFNNSPGNSSSQYWGRESPVLSQGSAYAKHVLSSPILDSKRSKKYTSIAESPGKSKKNKQAAKDAVEEFSFVQPTSGTQRARTLPDNRHLNRVKASEPSSVQAHRFSAYYDHKAPPTQSSGKGSRKATSSRQMSYGLLRFIDSDSPSPEL